MHRRTCTPHSDCSTQTTAHATPQPTRVQHMCLKPVSPLVSLLELNTKHVSQPNKGCTMPATALHFASARHHASRTHTTHAHHTQLVRERQNPSIHDKTCTDPAQPLRALFSAAADLLQHQHGKTARSRKQWSTAMYATAVSSTNRVEFASLAADPKDDVTQPHLTSLQEAEPKHKHSSQAASKTKHQYALGQDMMGRYPTMPAPDADVQAKNRHSTST